MAQIEDTVQKLCTAVQTCLKSIVDTSVKLNVTQQTKMGLSPKIVRKSNGGCCDWCNKLVGEYNYSDAPKDVYRRHENCSCTVEYSANGVRQNVYTKQVLTSAQDNDILEMRKTAGLTSAYEKAHPVNPVTGERYIKSKLAITSKQFGKKSGKHCKDWGLDASKAEDREKLKSIINSIADGAELRIYGHWIDQYYPVIAHISGSDVVLESKHGLFITIMKGCVDDAWIQRFQTGKNA